MVHSLRDGHSKVWIGEFWMKENFWTQKSFIAYINFKIFLCNGIHATVFFYVFLWICVEFIEFFCYIRTYIAVSEKKCNITGSSTTKWTKLNYYCLWHATHLINLSMWKANVGFLNPKIETPFILKTRSILCHKPCIFTNLLIQTSLVRTLLFY